MPTFLKLPSRKEIFSSHRSITLLTTLLFIFALFFITIKIIGYGYMPIDDALRHAAKAVSDKDWNQILLVRSDFKLDSYAGWHAILGFVRRIFNGDAHYLVIFSVTSLFLLFSLIPTILLKRPESWLLALLVINVMNPGRVGRLFLGRPYLVTSAAILAMMCLWEKLAEKKINYSVIITLTALVAMSVWIHSGWYLFCFPIAAFFIARQWRVGISIALITIVGSTISLMLTGHPIISVIQTLKHIFSAFTGYEQQQVLVLELRPFNGDGLVVITVIFMLIWRALRGQWDSRRLSNNPVFILMGLSWILGFLTTRIWADVGMTAVFLWIAEEFQDFLSTVMPFTSKKRLLFAALLSGTFFFAMTSDFGNRWSGNRPPVRIAFDSPETSSWAPGSGGIVYSNDMRVFFNMFYKNPNAPWRYILGYESGIMPPEDLATYRNIQLKFLPASFTPWVKKMRPEDRLIVFDQENKVATKIKELKWYDAGDSLWIGRLNENNQ